MTEMNVQTRFRREIDMLNDRLKEDRKKTGVVVDMRRSQMEYDLLELIYEGAISLEELEGFSEGLRERIRFMVEQY